MPSLELVLVLGVVVALLELGSRVGFCTLSAYQSVRSRCRRPASRPVCGAGTPLASTGGCTVAVHDRVAVAGGERVGAGLGERQVPLGVATLRRSA